MARETKNVLINRIIDRALARAAAQHASGRMLDIGCGVKPYRGLFAEYVDEHVGVDHELTPHGLDSADLVGTAYEIPAAPDSFDTVLCTSVLEHLEDPAASLAETRRVMREGGKAIYTVPFIWHLHEEPRDFFRYTPYSLRYLFENAGFELEEMKPLSGFWITFGQLFVYYLYRFNRGPLRRLRVIEMLGYLVQVLAAALDRVDRAEGWTWMYLVVARAAPQAQQKAA